MQFGSLAVQFTYKPYKFELLHRPAFKMTKEFRSALQQAQEVRTLIRRSQNFVKI